SPARHCDRGLDTPCSSLRRTIPRGSGSDPNRLKPLFQTGWAMSIEVEARAASHDRYEGLLDGAARFAADLDVPNALHAAFVRSPYAHARIRSIDVDDARSRSGVV